MLPGVDRTTNGALWLALGAISFLLLGPVCAAAENYAAAAPVKLAAVLDQHGGSDTACCTTFEDAALAGPAAQATTEAKYAATTPARVPLRLALATGTLLPRAGPLPPPRIQQSYFARSARILS